MYNPFNSAQNILQCLCGKKKNITLYFMTLATRIALYGASSAGS